MVAAVQTFVAAGCNQVRGQPEELKICMLLWVEGFSGLGFVVFT